MQQLCSRVARDHHKNLPARLEGALLGDATIWGYDGHDRLIRTTTPEGTQTVLDLDVGDVIRLRVGTDEPVQVRFSGVTKFLGRPGTRGGRHVVKLLGQAPSEGSHA